MKEILIDIETYSEVDIGKCGLYRYATDPSTEILLIAWATDEGSGFGETQCADIATGEAFPQELLDAFKDSSVKLIAHNAAFERVNFSCYLNQHYPGQYLRPGTFLSPDNWICTIYKLSQGAHEESERVQTSGTSNPVERTVLNCDKVLASMNREVQTQRTEQFLEPYYKVCEDIELFEIGLRSLRGLTRIVAEQLFVDGKKQTEITGLDGKLLGRRVVEREKEAALQGIADRICLYQNRRQE